MRMILLRNGKRVEAILLAAGRQRMRIAIQSETDGMELHRAGARWHGEDGSEVEIEALISVPGVDVSNLVELDTLAHAAGGDFSM
jgi:hypothetical protein